jgi:hypothetical protein
MGLTGLDADGLSEAYIGEIELLAATAIDALLALRVVATRARTDEERALLVAVAREARELEHFLPVEQGTAPRAPRPHRPAIEIAS